MDRKGQLVGQIIVFVIGLVVVGAVLFFGYHVLDNMNEQRCDVKRVTFGTDLSTQLDRHRDWGRTDDGIALETPCGTVAVCFIDRALKDDQVDVPAADDLPAEFFVSGVTSGAHETMLRSEADSASPANVFTVQEDGTVLPVERFNGVSAPVEIRRNGDPGVRCVAAPSGVVTLRMQGTGSHVRVSEGSA